MEIELLVDKPEQKNSTLVVSEDLIAAESDDIMDNDTLNAESLAQDSLFQSILRAVSSVFEPVYTALPESDASKSGAMIYSWDAYTSTGPGSYPPPPILDTPITGNPFYNYRDPASNFPWSTIYLADQACDGPLPASAAREHQVIVMLRGGCSFSQKLDNIPSFSPSERSLQLVIVLDEPSASQNVDDDDDDDDYGIDHRGNMPRPLLDTEQVTPKGIKRLHGIPMVLMGASRGDYELFRQATKVGMRRKYRVESQGLIVENAAVL